jgi:hypothetical protein
MNNLHFTNFQARQEITRTFRYRIRPVGTVDAAAVRRFGRDLLEPLQARHAPSAPLTVPEPPLRVTPAEPVLVELHPVHDGRVRARLRNITAASVEVEVARRGAEPIAVAVPAAGVADVLVESR